MIRGGIRQSLKEMRLEATNIFNSRYPRFVTNNDPGPLRIEVPVFVFHSIEPTIFEEQLKFLSNNNYHSVTCDQFNNFLVGRTELSSNSILLTIDDGRSSVWTYGYPLLKKYGFQATVFLIPGYIHEKDSSLRNLDDIWSGACDPKDLSDRDPELCSWSQIQEMHSSGIIDFQSHTLYHHKVFTNSRIIDFIRPGQETPIYDLVIPNGYEERLKLGSIEDFFGMPIFENASLMSGKPRYFNDHHIVERLIEHVSRNGGLDFWRLPIRRRSLYRLAAHWQRANGTSNRFQTKMELEEEIFINLLTSKRIIEMKLPGQQVQNLAYPYGVGSGMAVKISQQAGFVTNFWGVMRNRSTNQVGDDPFHCARLKADYIFRLPGKDRKPLIEVLMHKLARRLERRPVY